MTGPLVAWGKLQPTDRRTFASTLPVWEGCRKDGTKNRSNRSSWTPASALGALLRGVRRGARRRPKHSNANAVEGPVPIELANVRGSKERLEFHGFAGRILGRRRSGGPPEPTFVQREQGGNEKSTNQ